MHRAAPLFADQPKAKTADFLGAFHCEVRREGQAIVDQGDAAPDELLLLEGLAASHITDPQGRRICTGLFFGPQIITPQIARAENGISRVTIEMLTDGAIASLKARRLQDLMVADPDIRAWGNAALHAELVARSGREWALAALPAKERLTWFRRAHPCAEARFPHHLIASYLGMTPVTFSRMRKSIATESCLP